MHPIPVWKRSMDITGSLVLLAMLSPLLLGIGLYIRLSSKGPALFVQKRLGWGGKYFRIFKFRTLKPDDQSSHRDYLLSLDRSAPAVKPSLDDRFIPGGRWLREWSIDELPQLWNVLRGEMSLVGPRPDVLDLEDYKEHELGRFRVRPGITGLWQVRGKNSLSHDQMIELDNQYADNVRFGRDLSILFQTIKLLVQRDNQ